MLFYQPLDRITKPIPNIALTIGTFDGCHLGHKFILDELKNNAEQRNLKSCVYTFSSHPLQILSPQQAPLLLTSLEHKRKLIQEQCIDYLIFDTFSDTLSKMSAVKFLEYLKQYLDFQLLVLGPDNRIGANREGSPEVLKKISSQMNFELLSLPFYQKDSSPSSSKIREALARGDLPQVRNYLGRPFSYISNLVSGLKKGKETGFPTLNFSVEGLITPPIGVYLARAIGNKQTYWGAANLGFAPSFHEQRPLRLEVHLLNPSNLPENTLSWEIELWEFHRSEQKFSSIDALRKQIAKDVAHMKKRSLYWDYLIMQK